MSNVPARLKWQRSSFCADSQCVEVATLADMVHVRNSARPELVVSFTTEEWEALRKAIKGNEL